MSKQIKHVQLINLFRLCRKDEISFDIVAETGNIVAINGNNVEATFDIVERIVKLVAFDNVASTLLLVWTGLNGHVSVRVCPRAYLQNHTRDLYHFLCMLHIAVTRFSSNEVTKSQGEAICDIYVDSLLTTASVRWLCRLCIRGSTMAIFC